MALIENPAWQQFIAQLGDELELAQVLIRRLASGWELRHVADRDLGVDSLRPVKPAEARKVAEATSTGAFRPLKSSPNLQRGWRMVAAGEQELELALNGLYPGAIADWHAAQTAEPPVTDYREFAQRQSGMYRLLAKLDDAQAGRVITAGCDRKFCLKRRLWTVAGLAPDGTAGKSVIPCLEPCAVLMEFARQAARIGQETKVQLELAPAETATLKAALEAALARPDAAAREADFSAPDNPRRLQLVLAKLPPMPESATRPENV